MEKLLKAVNITKQYKDTKALNNVSLTIEPGKIYGLLGRNGAGKTTLLSALTSQISVTSGEVTYGGENVWENEKALSDICFSREINPVTFLGPNNLKVKDYLNAAKAYLPHWDNDYAEKLVKEFGLEQKKKVSKLSKGMMSMLTIVIAMASMAPITMLDEPVAGLDVVARELFYKLLIEDYTKTNRTFIVSTHIIEEAADAIEEIILMDKGTIMHQGNTVDFINSYWLISGKDTVIDEILPKFEVIRSESMGRSKSICVKSDYDTAEKICSSYDVDISALSLQKIFVYLTEGEKSVL